MVAGAAVIVTALAVAAAAIAIRGDGDDDDGGATTWNAVALVNRVNGAVRVLDEDGEEITTIRGTGRVDDVHASGDRLALVGATQIALVGIDGDEPIVIPIEQGSTVEPRRHRWFVHPDRRTCHGRQRDADRRQRRDPARRR